jgi:hypothetical protein
MVTVKLTCICGKVILIDIVGRENGNGKGICQCGEHITIHFRKRKGK